MHLSVRMPQFGESAAEATVVAWLVKAGQTVKAEQELVEVQTEKSLLTVSAPEAGVVVEIRAEAGASVKVGEPLAFLAIAGGSETATVATAPAPPPATATQTQIVAPLSASTPETSPAKPAAPLLPAPRRSTLRAGSGDGAFLSPRVRNRLEQHGLTPADLAVIAGSGRDGRVSANDIDAYAASGEPMSPVRQAVAAAMARSWSRPLATVALPVCIDALLAHRRTVPGRPSLTAYALRALALGFAAGSALRGRLVGSRVHVGTTIDLAVAVEVADGVLTPVIRKVDEIPFAELSARIDELVDRARAGRVNDAGEALATVSNYGTFGITWATPIPLPGHGSILGIGAPQNVPEWDPASKTFIRTRGVELTLTFDHRLADGGAAGRLVAKVVDLLEHPERLMA